MVPPFVEEGRGICLVCPLSTLLMVPERQRCSEEQDQTDVARRNQFGSGDFLEICVWRNPK